MVDQAQSPWQPLLASWRQMAGTDRRADEDREKAVVGF
jgi:hypothetical protein